MMKLVEMIFIITNLNKLIRTKLNKKEEPEIYIDNFFLSNISKATAFLLQDVIQKLWITSSVQCLIEPLYRITHLKQSFLLEITDLKYV